MNIEIVSINKIKLNENNPRFIKDENFIKLVKSIKEFPEMLNIRPIVVNDEMIILGGNMRYKACKEAGLHKVPIIIAKGLTADQEKEFIIKDNVSGGEWDWELLKTDWDMDKLIEWSLEIPKEIMEIIEPDEIIEAIEDDFDITPPVHPKTVLGDMYEIGEHKLLCGSSTKIDTWEKLFNDKLADLIVTDPPYNVNYEGSNGLKIINDEMKDNEFYHFLYDFYTALGSYTKKGGAWYVWHADSEAVNFRKAFIDSGLLLKQCLIWVKNALVLGRQDYQWKHEPCIYGWKEGAAHFFIDERNHTTVIEDEIDFTKLSKKQLLDIIKEANSDKISTSVIKCNKPTKNDVHPTMKPILLLAPLISNSSKPGEIVADGFLGSGSTMVASHQLKRKCYGMELDPKYCDVIVKRMIKLDDTLTVKRNGVDCTNEFKIK